MYQCYQIITCCLIIPDKLHAACNLTLLTINSLISSPQKATEKFPVTAAAIFCSGSSDPILMIKLSPPSFCILVIIGFWSGLVWLCVDVMSVRRSAPVLLQTDGRQENKLINNRIDLQQIHAKGATTHNWDHRKFLNIFHFYGSDEILRRWISGFYDL